MSAAAGGRLPARPFFKMTGSGNDFVFFDTRADRAFDGLGAEQIQRLCARGTGVGADGVVLLGEAPTPGVAFRMTYFNSDGSRGAMCGNAALCSTMLATRLGLADGSGMRFETDSGEVDGRVDGGRPEIALAPVAQWLPEAPVTLERGERRIGFALVGVPHIVVLTDDVAGVDVPGRGAALRRHPLRPEGANANFVSRGRDGWSIRTFERGVEAETLACGTGAVATALLLHLWGLSGDEAHLTPPSGSRLRVRLRRTGAVWQPWLQGEGRLVFSGELGSV